MQFESNLTEATLLKREKSYLIDVAVNMNDKRKVFCPNEGSLFGCNVLGSRVWFSTSNIVHRKYRFTWEIVEVERGELVYVNEENKATLFKEALEANSIPLFQDVKDITMYATVLGLAQKADLQFTHQGTGVIMMIESITMGDEIHRGFTPDQPSINRCKILRDLMTAKENGFRAILMYSVQHTGIERVFPADHIDSVYGNLLRQAVAMGVEVIAYKIDINLQEVRVAHSVPVVIPVRSARIA